MNRPPGQPVVLGIETSTEICGVAVAVGERLVQHARAETPRAHAKCLAPMIRDVLDQAGLSPREITAVAVSIGPGSFTGLRIGLSTAKGLVMATGATLVPVSTLEALAHAVDEADEAGDTATGRDTRIARHPNAAEWDRLAVLHARADEWYVARFQLSGRSDPPALIDLAGATPMDRNLLADTVVGPDAVRFVAALPDATGVTPVAVEPSAACVTRIGLLRLSALEPVDPAIVEPAYVRRYVAKKAGSRIFNKVPSP